MTVLVLLDEAHPAGRLADPSQPQLLVTDLGVSRGDGVFETLLAVDGMALKLQAHLDRLQSSARMLDLAIPADDAWRAALNTGLAEFTANDDGERTTAMVKFVATRGTETGPTCWILLSDVPATSAAQRTDGIEIVLLNRGLDSAIAESAPWLLLGAKTLSYAINMAALRYAKSHGADDAIFVSSDGRVLEGPTSSVLIARSTENGRQLLTPLLESGVLPGTTQGAIFDAAAQAGWELGYGPLVPEDLYENDGVWLVSSVRLMAPIKSIDGRELEFSRELTEELTELLLTATRS